MYAGTYLSRSWSKAKSSSNVAKQLNNVPKISMHSLPKVNFLESSNVQFGEGGAGTFSDGKLTTRMKNVRVSKVYEEFVEAGANPAILYQHALI